MLGARIRELRKKRGISGSELARRSGVSKSLISQIENDKANPSVDTIRAVAFALGVPVFTLFMNGAQQQGGLVRKMERPVLYVPGSDAKRELLTPRPARRMVAVMASLAPGKSSSKSPVTHNGEEWIFVLRGDARIIVGDNVYELNEGDAVYFDAQLPHQITNIGFEEAEFLSVGTQDWSNTI